MDIVVILLNRDSRSILMSVSRDGNDQLIRGSQLPNEKDEVAADRILKENGVTVIEGVSPTLVKFERYTRRVRNGFDVGNVSVYVYEVDNKSHSLYISPDSKCAWISVGVVLNDLCDSCRYTEASYVSDACDVV